MQDRDAAEQLYRNSRREAIIVGVVWFLATAWTVGYCYLHGYQHDEGSWVVQQGWAAARDSENFRQFFGVPDWVAIGIVLPWLLCTTVTVAFCALVMKDDDLGVEGDEEAGHGH